MRHTVLTHGGQPVLLAVAVRSSETTPGRHRVALVAPLHGELHVMCAPFRLEMS